MKRSYFFILFFFAATASAQQEDLRSMIVCRHWLAKKTDLQKQGSYSGNDTTILLRYAFKKEDIYNTNIAWGLVLDKNGTYEERYAAPCGNGRKPGIGTWTLQSDTLILTQSVYSQSFKIIRITDKALGLRILKP